MALLILFGFIAGAATALSPCVLPVLPIALSAGATGGRRRPLGIVAGLAVSFTFASVALVYVISALAIARAIVEAHGGKIWLEDGMPGTRVHFTLKSV